MIYIYSIKLYFLLIFVRWILFILHEIFKILAFRLWSQSYFGLCKVREHRRHWAYWTMNLNGNCKLKKKEREHSCYKCEACLSNMHRVWGFCGLILRKDWFECRIWKKTYRHNCICFCRNVSTETLILRTD